MFFQKGLGFLAFVLLFLFGITQCNLEENGASSSLYGDDEVLVSVKTITKTKGGEAAKDLLMSLNSTEAIYEETYDELLELKGENEALDSIQITSAESYDSSGRVTFDIQLTEEQAKILAADVEEEELGEDGTAPVSKKWFRKKTYCATSRNNADRIVFCQDPGSVRGGYYTFLHIQYRSRTRIGAYLTGWATFGLSAIIRKGECTAYCK